MTGLDLQIERYRLKTGSSYLDSVLDFAEEHNMCLYEIAEQLHSSIKKNLLFEARKRNLIKGERITTSMESFFE